MQQTYRWMRMQLTQRIQISIPCILSSRFTDTEVVSEVAKEDGLGHLRRNLIEST